MRRVFMFTILLFTLVLSAFVVLPAQTIASEGVLYAGAEKDNIASSIMVILAPLLVSVLAPIGIRLFKKLGIELQDSILEPVILQIIQIIAGIEADKYVKRTGTEKLEIAVSMADKQLSTRSKKLLISRYGDMPTAVEQAFQRSHIPLKQKK